MVEKPGPFSLIVNLTVAAVSSRKHIESLLGPLSQDLGEDLSFDENDVCVFAAGKGRDGLIAMPKDGQAALFAVSVAPVSSDRPEALFRHLLVLNFTDELTEGAALGLAGEDAHIVLRYTADADALDLAAVQRIIGNLAAAAARLEAALAAWQQEQGPTGAAPQADSADEPLDSAMPDFGGFA